MDYDNHMRDRDSTRIVLDPPTFTPPPEMRAAYLDKHKAEVDDLLDDARAGEWKPVMTAMNHVRGTGEMYGFHKIGEAAEAVVKAVQNGDANSLAFMEDYARIVGESSV